MRQFFKRLLAPLLLMTALSTSVSLADGIRLVGPSGEVQSSPSFSEQVERANSPLPLADEPSRFYGPTAANETLWSIASKLRPANNVSVQQTLLAIYRLNPQAFENQNIHSLLPGSTLRVPSLAQVRSASTEQAVTVMRAHQDKLNAAPAVPAARPAQPVPVTPPANPQPATPAQPVTETRAVQAQPEAVPASSANRQVSTLEKQLEMSESELSALEEKNHSLRLMLAEVQSEVDGLKSELGDENRIRSEVERLLAEERAKLEEQQRLKPSAFDQFLSNGWMVAAAALVPGALIGWLIISLLGRRKEAESTQSNQQTETPIVPPVVADNDLDDLSLDDDLLAEGDDNTELLFDDDSEQSNEDDIFGDLEDSDLDFNLEGEDGEDPFASIGDDGELDTDFDEFDSSANGISVKGSDKALGLEEMERALDEVSPELEIADEEEHDFDLSDENVGMSDDDLAELLATDEPTEDLGDNALDQSVLDDLFANLDAEDESDEFDLGLDDDLADQSESKQMSEAMSGAMASDEDIDSLLAQFNEPVVDESELATDNALDELESLLESGTDESAPDDLATSLLDELVDEVEEDEVSLDPLDELEALAGLTEDELAISASETDLLDEMLDEADEDPEEFDPLSELEELSTFGEAEALPEITEDSTDLLDELLEVDQESDDSLLWTEELPQEADQTESDPFDELITLDEALDESNEFDFATELDAALDSSDDVVELSVSEPQPDSELPSLDVIEDAALQTSAPYEADASNIATEQNERQDQQSEPEVAPESNTDFDDAFEPTEFNSTNFAHDLANVAPTLDPLLDALPEETDQNGSTEPDLDTNTPETQQSTQDSIAQEAPVSETWQPEKDAESSLAEDTIEAFDDLDDEDDWLQAAIDQVENPLNAEDEVDFATQSDSLEQDRGVEAQRAVPSSEREENTDDTDEDWLQSAIDEVESAPTDLTQSDLNSQEPSLDVEETPTVLDDEAVFSELDDAPTGLESTEQLTTLEQEAFSPPEVEAESRGDAHETAQAMQDNAAAQPQQAIAEETPTPNAVPNEFGTPVEEDWAEAESLFDGFTSQVDQTQPQQEESLATLETPKMPSDDAQQELGEPISSAEDASEADESLDAVELPEFDEEDALEALADESAQEADAVLGEEAIGLDELALTEFVDDGEGASFSEQPEFDGPSLNIELDDVDFDDIEFPEFGEEEALASMTEEPLLSEVELSETDAVTPTIDESELLEPNEGVIANVDDFQLDEDALPEFGEEEALAAMADEPNLADSEPQEIDLADEIEFDELELPEFGEEDALAAMADEPSYDASDAPLNVEETFEPKQPDVESDAGEQSISQAVTPALDVETEPSASRLESSEDQFDFDELELPEFGEEDAAQALASEPNLEPTAAPEAESDDFEIDDVELPEFGEEDAIAAVAEELDEAPNTSEPEEQDYRFDALELPSMQEDGVLNTVQKPHISPSSYEEQSALFDVFAQEAGFELAEEEVLHQEFDEAAMADLLSEESLDNNFFADSPDSDTVASAGMDLEAMLEFGGDDWAGFKLPEENSAHLASDVPAEEREIWSSQEALTEPSIDEENWADQEAFDPKQNQFMTIDELMAQVDDEPEAIEEQDLKLDVGLDEFPDVIGEINDVDVDENAEASGKLDLAKIYIEMNDAEGAVKLLEEAIVYGDDDVRREAKNLIDILNGR